MGFNSLSPHADLSLATVIHSLSCHFSSSSKPSFSRVEIQAWRMVYYDFPIGRGVGYHAPSIRLGDLDFSIALSLESHRILRSCIINSIVGEFPAALLTCSFVIRFSAISNIAHLHILPRQL
jgi:hypothetical protein